MISNNKDFKQRILEVTTPLPGSTPMPTHYKLPVKKKYEGLSIVDFFLKTVPKANKNVWLEKINHQSLLLNGKPATTKTMVKGGDITEHFSAPKTEPFVSNQIELLYEDDHLLIVNKPAPLPMHPSGRFYKNTLTEILKLAFPEEDLKIIHRLDANTTGIVILGKNKEIVKSIGTQFEKKQVVKKYLALVEGIPTKSEFNSNTKINTEKNASGGRNTSESGQDAYTEFKVLQKDVKNQLTLLEVTPHTGRTNQIRLHLANLGLPIVGDLGYKNSDYFKNHPLTYDTDCLYLHAWKLTITYSQKLLHVTAPIPLKFSKILIPINM